MKNILFEIIEFCDNIYLEILKYIFLFSNYKNSKKKQKNIIMDLSTV